MRNIAMIITLAISLLPSLSGNSQDRPEFVAGRLASAWNAHDMEALGRLFSEDADWVTVGGDKLKGRSEIQSLQAKEHSTWAKTTLMSVTTASVRKIDRNNSVVYFKWSMSGVVGRDGKVIDEVRGAIMLVVSRKPTGWQIVAGQVARVP